MSGVQYNSISTRLDEALRNDKATSAKDGYGGYFTFNTQSLDVLEIAHAVSRNVRKYGTQDGVRISQIVNSAESKPLREKLGASSEAVQGNVKLEEAKEMMECLETYCHIQDFRGGGNTASCSRQLIGYVQPQDNDGYPISVEKYEQDNPGKHWSKEKQIANFYTGNGQKISWAKALNDPSGSEEKKMHRCFMDAVMKDLGTSPYLSKFSAIIKEEESKPPSERNQEILDKNKTAYKNEVTRIFFEAAQKASTKNIQEEIPITHTTATSTSSNEPVSPHNDSPIKLVQVEMQQVDPFEPKDLSSKTETFTPTPIPTINLEPKSPKPQIFTPEPKSPKPTSSQSQVQKNETVSTGIQNTDSGGGGGTKPTSSTSTSTSTQTDGIGGGDGGGDTKTTSSTSTSSISSQTITVVNKREGGNDDKKPDNTTSTPNAAGNTVIHNHYHYHQHITNNPPAGGNNNVPPPPEKKDDPHTPPPPPAGNNSSTSINKTTTKHITKNKKPGESDKPGGPSNTSSISNSSSTPTSKFNGPVVRLDRHDLQKDAKAALGALPEDLQIKLWGDTKQQDPCLAFAEKNIAGFATMKSGTRERVLKAIAATVLSISESSEPKGINLTTLDPQILKTVILSSAERARIIKDFGSVKIINQPPPEGQENNAVLLPNMYANMLKQFPEGQRTAALCAAKLLEECMEGFQEGDKDFFRKMFNNAKSGKAIQGALTGDDVDVLSVIKNMQKGLLKTAEEEQDGAHKKLEQKLADELRMRYQFSATGDQVINLYIPPQGETTPKVENQEQQTDEQNINPLSSPISTNSTSKIQPPEHSSSQPANAPNTQISAERKAINTKVKDNIYKITDSYSESKLLKNADNTKASDCMNGFLSGIQNQLSAAQTDQDREAIKNHTSQTCSKSLRSIMINTNTKEGKKELSFGAVLDRLEPSKKELAISSLKQAPDNPHPELTETALQFARTDYDRREEFGKYCKDHNLSFKQEAQLAQTIAYLEDPEYLGGGYSLHDAHEIMRAAGLMEKKTKKKH